MNAPTQSADSQTFADLAADNVRAVKVRIERENEFIRDMIRRYGITPVLHTLAEQCAEIAEDAQNLPEVMRWVTVGHILEAAAVGCDLPNSDSPIRYELRALALKNFKQMAMEVK